MARDFLTSQIRTNQIIASRSLSTEPSLFIISASNADGLGSITPPLGAGADTFIFVSGSRSTDAFVVLGGSAKISGSLTVFDNVVLGQSSADVIDFEGRIASNIVPSSNKTYTLGIPSFQWDEINSSTGSFEFLAVSQRSIFPSQISGSIQRTASGLSYLVAGSGVTISSASSGQITISAAGGAGSPGGSNTQVQFNDSGGFGGDDGLIYDKTTKTLTVGNLIVTGSVTAITTSNLTISDPVVYIASGALTSNFKSIIAFASGSTEANKSLIFGANGANDILAAAKQDVQGGSLAQTSISFSELVPIRASSFQVGGSVCFITSSNSTNLLMRSTAGEINILPGSAGLRLGNAAAPIAVSGSDVRFGTTSAEFGSEIPPIPGSDVYFFVSGSGTSRRALFGGDVVSSGSILVKGPAGTTSVIGTAAGVLSASSNIQGGGNLLIAGNATVRGGLLTLSETIGDGILEQTPLGDLELRNLYTGGSFVASVRTSAGVTSNFLDVRPNGSLTGSVVSIFPSSIYAGAGNPFNSSDTTFFVAGKRDAKDGITRGTSVFGGDVVTSGSLYVGTSTTDSLVVNSLLASDIIPDGNRTRNLGSDSARFANIFTGDLHLKNERGDYTLIEEEDCLTIRFNKTGKRYKFVLEPAPEFD